MSANTRPLWIATSLAFIIGLGGAFLISGQLANSSGTTDDAGIESAPPVTPGAISSSDLFGRDLPLLEVALALESKLARNGTGEEFADAWKRADQMPLDREGEHLQELILRWWTRIDPDAALTFADSIRTNYKRWIAVDAVFTEWGLLDADAAIEAAQHPQADKPNSESRIKAVIEGVTQTGQIIPAIKLATEHAISVDLNTIRIWSQAEPESTRTYLLGTDLTSPFGDLPLLTYAKAIPEDHVESCLNFLTESDLLRKPELRENLLPRLVERLARKDPAQIMKLLEVNTRLSETKGLVADTIKIWAQEKPESARQWFASLPKADEKRRAAAPGMVLGGLITEKSELENLLLSTNPREIESLTSAILRLPQESLEAQLAWIDSWRGDLFESDYQSAIASALIDFDSSAADAESLARAIELSEFRGGTQAVHLHLGEFARRFPQEAATWLDRGFNNRPPATLMTTVAAGWPTSRLDELADWLASHPSSAARRAAWSQLQGSLPVSRSRELEQRIFPEGETAPPSTTPDP